MRIAIFVNNYPPRTGGLEYHVENLGRALAKMGHEVWVLTILNPPGKRFDHGVHVLTGSSHFPIAGVISFPSWGSTRTIAKSLRELKIDIVATNTRFFPMTYVGVRAAQKAGLPIIHTEHGSGFVATENPVVWLGSRIVDLTFGRFVLRSAHKVLGVSQAVVDFVKDLSDKPANVFYNAITPPRDDVTRPDRPHHLVFVGRLVAGKGWDTFLETFAWLTQQGVNVTGEVIGDGPQLDDVRHMIHELNLDNLVSAPGRIDPASVRQKLAGATLVNPSTLSEGFQTTLVEALAEQGRVVTFPVPGADLLLAKGASILICQDKTAAALRSTLLDYLRAPLPPSDPTLIKDLTWPEQAQRYTEFCREVIADFRR